MARVFAFNKLPTPSFLSYPIKRRVGKKEGIVTLIRSETLNDTSAPASQDLLSWIRFYFRTDVIGVESDQTARSKIYDLFKFVAYYHAKLPSLDLKHWDRPFTQQFVNELELAYKQSSIYRIFATLTNFASFLVLQESLRARDNPTRNIRLGDREDLPDARGLQVVDRNHKQLKYSGNQIYSFMLEVARDRISQSLPPRARPRRDAAILTVLYGTGLRVTELCALRFEQMRKGSLEKGMWFDNVKCKGKGTRKVYLQSKYVDDLLAYTDQSEERLEGEPWIFQSYRGHRLTQPTIYHILLSLAKEAREKYLPSGAKILVSPHSLRHERGYNLKKADKGDSFVQKGLGHKDTRQVTRYSRQSEIAEEVEFEDV